MAAALRLGQDQLAGNPRFAAPFYWAGFVIIGEGTQRVGLEKSFRPLRWLAILALLVALGVGSRLLFLRFRS